MKNSVLSNLILIAAVGGLAACGAKTSDRQAPPETFSSVLVEEAQSQTLADPKVNILFVVDNSGSMKGYQAKMAANIERFADKFFANKRIDYRIGVVPVYDSKYLNDQTVYASGRRKMNPLGELVSLKGMSPDDNGSKLFITRDTLDAKEVLKKTVVLGVQWGPEAEESFSPVLAVADERINQEKNQGFYQSDAYLAVVLLTDADDVTLNLSGEQFYQKLVALKGGDRSKILVAAALPNLKVRDSDRTNKNCTTDGDGPVKNIPDLLTASGGIFADLCSEDFGSHLASFGDYLIQRVAAQRITLKFTPDINTLSVSYGAPDLPEGSRIPLARGAEGYYFDPQTNEIVISPTLSLPRLPNGVIFVKATPVNLSNYRNKRLKEI